MIATTFTSAQFEERVEKAIGNLGLQRSRYLSIVAKVREVAEAANQLGLQGHGIKDVEFILEDGWGIDPKLHVRVIPKFKLKTT